MLPRPRRSAPVVVLRDVCRIEEDGEVLDVLLWTATAILRAAGVRRR
jgi:hypothetical protein